MFCFHRFAGKKEKQRTLLKSPEGWWRHDDNDIDKKSKVFVKLTRRQYLPKACSDLPSRFAITRLDCKKIGLGNPVYTYGGFGRLIECLFCVDPSYTVVRNVLHPVVVDANT